MDYQTTFKSLRQQYNPAAALNQLDDATWALNHTFQSTGAPQLPAGMDLRARDSAYKALLRYFLSRNQYSDQYVFKLLGAKDTDVTENQTFKYTLVSPSPDRQANDVIILFHGLNEKRWDKYLPWAKALMQKTGKAVLLFPIAFHMDRAPKSWSDPRLMAGVTTERQTLFPDDKHSSFANAAISHRLQFAPQRFLMSGLQTFYDLLTMVGMIKRGEHPNIAANAGIDFFAYSIGGMLAQVLLMANVNDWFAKTRLFLFASGSTLNRMNPANRVILDGEASEALTLYYTKIFNPHFQNDHDVAWFVESDSAAMTYFKSLLHFDYFQSERETRLKEIGRKIKALALAQDRVISPMGVLPTVEGRGLLTGAAADVTDFDFEYSHENPFKSKNAESVNAAFHRVFNAAADHLA